jgi:hypothetical protein
MVPLPESSHTLTAKGYLQGYAFCVVCHHSGRLDHDWISQPCQPPHLNPQTLEEVPYLELWLQIFQKVFANMGKSQGFSSLSLERNTDEAAEAVRRCIYLWEHRGVIEEYQ